MLNIYYNLGSEHQIDCKSEAAEVHLVMKADVNGNTRYMVLGFMFRVWIKFNLIIVIFYQN